MAPVTQEPKPAQSERERLRQIAATRSAAERDIEIPAVVNRRRRSRGLRDPFYFLRTYFPERYYNKYTTEQRERIKLILHRVTHGGDQAFAAPRGDGKTTDIESLMIYCGLKGLVRFPLIVAATGPDARRILANIKYEFETNSQLRDDFPEVCVPIHALEGAPQRASMQTVAGERTMLHWAQDHIILPTVPGSVASGCIFSTRGLDAAIRGVRYRNTRPDVVIVDDPETRESADSEAQTRKREEIIEKDLGGLGGQSVAITRIMLCTIIKRSCLADKYTDRKEKPSWNGKRYQLLKKPPSRDDLWAEYVQTRQAGMEQGDDLDGRDAHRFYLKNRKAMDAGAKLGNPARFVGDPYDGSTRQKVEVSALQHCYNIIADRGWGPFATEYQNDPPTDDGPQTSGISAGLVMSRLSGIERNVAPDETDALVAFIDLGKYALYWSVAAWRRGVVGHVIDYGVQDVFNVDVIGESKAIGQALRILRDDMNANPYVLRSGEIRRFDRVLVDAGNWSDVAYAFCRESGVHYKPSKGYGESEKSPFRVPKKNNATTRVGRGGHWYESKQPGGHWLTIFDADHWKRYTHERWLTVPRDDDDRYRTGSLTVFGADPKTHLAYAKHQVAEVEEEEFIRGKGIRRRFKRISKANHWLDSTVGCCLAAAQCGIDITARPAAPRKKKRRKVRAKLNPQTPAGWLKK